MQDAPEYNYVSDRPTNNKSSQNLSQRLGERGTSTGRYKKWSPEISNDERYRKKKQREDVHIKKLLHDPTVIGSEDPQKARSIRVQAGTGSLVETPSGPYNSTNHDSRELSPYQDLISLNALYEIQGLEFLQENFLELEPLLYKDEYAFDSRLVEEAFEKEQRKLKDLRRKQYTQKDQKSNKGAATIMSVNQYKDRLTDFLEEWYAKNMRKMTKEEIIYVAKQLDIDSEAVANLQDMYLKKKKIINAEKLRDYLMADGKVRNDRINKLPAIIRRHFIMARAKNQKKTASKSRSKSPIISKTQSIKQSTDNHNTLPVISRTSEFKNSTPSIPKQSVASNQRPSEVIPKQSINSIQRPSETSPKPSLASSKRNEDPIPKMSTTSNQRQSERSPQPSLKSTNKPNDISPKQSMISNQRLSENSPRLSGSLVQRQSEAGPKQSVPSVQRQSEQTGKLSSVSDKKPAESRITEEISPEYHNSSHYRPGERDSEMFHDDIRMYYDTEINAILDRIRGNDNNTLKSNRLQSTKDPSIINRDKNFSEVINRKIASSIRNPSNSIQTPNRKSTSPSKAKISNADEQPINRPSKLTSLNEKKSVSGLNPKSSIANQQNRGPKTSQLVEEIAKEVLSKHTSVHSNRPKVESTPSNHEDQRESLSNSRSKDYSSPIRISSQLNHYQAHPSQYKERGDAEFTDNRLMRMTSQLNHYNVNPYIYRAPGLTLIDMVPEEPETLAEVDVYGEEQKSTEVKQSLDGNNRNSSAQDFTRKNPRERIDSDTRNKTSTFGQSNEKAAPIKSKTSSVFNKTMDAKRITVVSKTDKGDSIVSQKLRPTLVGNHYYYQIIDDVLYAEGGRTIFVTVKDEQGEIVASHPVNLSTLGSFHHSAVIFHEEPKTKSRQATLIVRNEMGGTVCATEIPIDPNDQRNYSVQAVFGSNNDRRSTIIQSRNSTRNLTVHQLKPFVVGNEFYRQSIVENHNPDGTRITITTYNENGEAISISNVNPEVAGKTYASYVADEFVDEKNIRHFSVNTVNNKGQLVDVQSFSTQIESFMKDFKAAVLLEEIEDMNGRRTLTLVERNSTTKSIFMSRQYRPSILGEQYYIEIVNDTVDKNGKRTTTVSAKSNSGQKLVERVYAPTNTSYLVNDFLLDLQRCVEEEINKDLSENQTLPFRPMLEDYIVEVREVSQSVKEPSKSLIVAAKDSRGHTIIQRSYRSNGTTNMAGEFIADVLADLEAELFSLKRSSIAKKSVLGNRISHNNPRASKLEPVPEVKESTSHSINNEVGNRNSRNDSNFTFDNKRDTITSSQFPPQNIYYRRLLETLMQQTNHRGSLPVEVTYPFGNNDVKRKANTIAVNYRDDSKEIKRSNTESSTQKYDKSKTTVDIKNELAKENSFASRRKTSQNRPNNFSDIRVKSPSASLLAKRESKVSLNDKAPESERESKIIQKLSIQSLQNSQLRASQPKEIEPTHSTRNSRVETVRDSKIRDSAVHSRNLNDSLRNDDEHSKHDNHLSRLSEQHAKITEQLAKLSETQNRSKHDSFNPRDSMDDQTRNLIEKSHQLKNYLDDYINTLSNTRKPKHNDLRDSRDHSLHNGKKNSFKASDNRDEDHSFTKHNTPSIVSETRFSGSHDHTDHSPIKYKKLPSSAFDESNLRKKIEEVFEAEKEKLSDEVLERVRLKAQEESLGHGNLMEEFYQFCQNELPLDKKYKDSMMLVSLFYYFLERKNLIK